MPSSPSFPAPASTCRRGGRRLRHGTRLRSPGFALPDAERLRSRLGANFERLLCLEARRDGGDDNDGLRLVSSGWRRRQRRALVGLVGMEAATTTGSSRSRRDGGGDGGGLVGMEALTATGASLLPLWSLMSRQAVSERF